jgi:hypothetical protein
LNEAHVRKIDYVKEPGEDDQPLWLCTFDFTLSKLNEPEEARSGKRKKKKTRKDKTFREKKERSVVYKSREETLAKLKVEPVDVVLPYSWVEKRCLKPYCDQFYRTWNDAIESYYRGEWDQALPLFENINDPERFRLDKREPISLMMLQRMAKMGEEPEETWEKWVEVVFK